MFKIYKKNQKLFTYALYDKSNSLEIKKNDIQIPFVDVPTSRKMK